MSTRRSLLLLLALVSMSACFGSGTPDAEDAAEQMQSWLEREFPEQFRVERVDVSNSRMTDVHGRPAYAFDGIVHVRLLVDQKVTTFERIAQPWLGELEGKSGETKQTRTMVFTWVKEGAGWKWSHFTSDMTNADLFGRPTRGINVPRRSSQMDRPTRTREATSSRQTGVLTKDEALHILKTRFLGKGDLDVAWVDHAKIDNMTRASDGNYVGLVYDGRQELLSDSQGEPFCIRPNTANDGWEICSRE